MKKWLWASFILFACLCAGYATSRFNTNVSELAPFEKTLTGAKLISIRVVGDTSDSRALLPRPEVQKIYVIHERESQLLDKFPKVPEGWFWTWGDYVNAPPGIEGQYPCFFFQEQIYTYPGWGKVTVVPGQATEQTKFGARVGPYDSKYSTVYISWVKNDIVSNVLSNIKRP